MCVGIMRTEAGRDPHDRGLQDLVGELSTRSETFRRLWAAHDVRTHGTGTKRFHHPVVGELTLAYEELAITAEPGLVLLVYTAEPGSPSAERLRLLASWAASEQAPVQSTAYPGRDLHPMKLTRSSADTASGPADWFTGDVYIDAIRNPDDQSAVGCAHVRFTPGARTAGTPTPRARPSTSPTASATSPAAAASRPRRSAPATSSTSSPARSTGTAPPPAGSWPTSPSRRPTTRARS